MKIRIIACITASALLFTGASVWEGAAVQAAADQLPETGYFAATNSFPRNTVVDITNLENGRTTRVIISGVLETTGLLARLSREAAEAIGLQNGSIGRIRMSQPADSIAFSRFTEGESVAQSRAPAADSGTAESDGQPSSPVNTWVPRSIIPVYYPEPEWEDDAFRDVAEVPDVYSPPQTVVEEEIAREPPPLLADPPPVPVAEPQMPAPLETVQVPVVPVEEPYQPPPAASPPPQAISPPPLAASPPPPAVSPPPPDTSPPPSVAENPPAAAGQYRYSLVPSEERKPQSSHSLSPEDFVSPIDDAGPVQSGPPPRAPSVASPSVASSSNASAHFPVPLINGLEHGKYYVQLGAFNRAELVEDEISRIGTNYPLAVQNTGNDENPLFRILLGPLNRGESGALLQRFKSIGYKDAFVRKN
jgi:hypothetical protein